MPAACAWPCEHKGDEGTWPLPSLAEQFLTTTAKQKVDALLQSDTDRLTANDIADPLQARASCDKQDTLKSIAIAASYICDLHACQTVEQAWSIANGLPSRDGDAL